MESDALAPKWKSLWQEVKRSEPIIDDDIQNEVQGNNCHTIAETSLLSPLNHALIDLGYDVDLTNDDFLNLMLETFSDQCIDLFDIEDSEAISAPYPGIMEPLEKLVELKENQEHVSYKVKKSKLSVYLNKEIVGVINLDDVLEQSSYEYFNALFELAKEWFPEQVYLYAAEEIIAMFILPTKIITLLQTNGHISSQQL